MVQCWCIAMPLIFMFILHPETLLNLFVLTIFWMYLESLEYSSYEIMSSVNRDNITSSFPTWMTFIYFSCFIAMLQYYIKLRWWDWTAFFSDFRERNTLNYWLLHMMLAVDLLIYSLYYFEKYSFYTEFVGRFYLNGV